MDQRESMRGFFTAANLLPERLWRAAYALTEEQRPLCEEIRVRLERPMTALIAGEQVSLPACATSDEMQLLLARASEHSVHTVEGQLREGFVTTKYGHRLGICGEAVLENGKVRNIRSLSSMNIRIAKQSIGIADGLLPDLCFGGFQSTLILAPPGAGKTTLLRDLCRALSRDYQIAVADERFEIAACFSGAPRFDVGLCDVFTGGSKAEVLSILTRGMAPQIIATDEITKPEDCRALMEAAACGCRFLATAHGDTPDDLRSRPVYRELLSSGIFRRTVSIRVQQGERLYQMAELEETDAANHWDRADGMRLRSGRISRGTRTARASAGPAELVRRVGGAV